LPAGLVEEQLANLWAEVEEELKTNPEKFKNENQKSNSDPKRLVMAVKRYII
jgi:FKBP-type peptidyl-prolyl cis-trans isomerase (trigger factor)